MGVFTVIFLNPCSTIWSKTAHSLTTSTRTRRKVMSVNLSRLMTICWTTSCNPLMQFAMNGSSRMREPCSLRCMRRRGTFLFCDLSKLRKTHKPRPEFTPESLRSVTDDGEMKSGVLIDATRIWSCFERILWIYDIEETSDVSREQSPS